MSFLFNFPNMILGSRSVILTLTISYSEKKWSSLMHTISFLLPMGYFLLAAIVSSATATATAALKHPLPRPASRPPAGDGAPGGNGGVPLREAQLHFKYFLLQREIIRGRKRIPWLWGA